MEPSTFMLVPEITATGETQMEIDAQLLEAVTLGYVRGVLRFYRFDPSCVTYGRFQPLTDFNTDAVNRDGIDLIQRPTGGTAVYHGPHDITYAFASTIDNHVFGGTILQSAAAIHTVIQEALTWLDIPSVITEATGDKPKRASDCFAIPAPREVVDSDGIKLVGSAQVRNRTAFLQHGIIPMDPSRIDRYLATPGMSSSRSCISALAPSVTYSELTARIINCFTTALGSPFTESSVLMPGMAIAHVQ